MRQRKMLFIFNPKAGMEAIRLNTFELIDLFTRGGFLVTAYPTQSRRDAYEMTLKYARHYDYLVCAGGDGTLNEVIDAMMQMPRKPPLGYIPCGTTNDFATTLGLSKDFQLAAQTVCEGIPYAVDIGKFNKDYFSYIAAFGLFTDVSYGTSQSLKNVLGHTAYMLEGVKRLANIKSYRCTVRIGKKEFTNDFIFGMVSNSNSIGGFRLPVEKETKLDDGLFEVVLLKKLTRFSQLHQVIAILMGNETSCDAMLTFRTDNISVVSDQGLKWTLDGEYGGDYSKVDIQNIRQAVQIIVPQTADF